MLTIDQIRKLAKQNDIKLTNHWQAITHDDEPAQLQSMSLRFTREAPEAWATLMSNLSEVPCSLTGTRQVTGSGATDGTFFPCYEALLPEVNLKRKEIGLDRAF